MVLIKVEEKYEYLKDTVLSLLLICIAFIINKGISIRGLYMDDLLMWSTRRGTGFLKYVFPYEMRKFRPVYWAVVWIYQGIIKNNTDFIVPINILIGAGISIAIYFFAKKIAYSKTIAFLSATMFSVSRFSYYDIGQYLGLMEAMAIIFAFALCVCLYKYINGKANRYFYYACLFYFLDCFTHERFVVLFPMLIFAVIVKNKNRIINALAAISIFILSNYIRFMALKSFIPEGTGNSKVTETFKLSSFFASVKTEVLYLFGINTGPTHLNGIDFNDINIAVKILIIIGIIAFAIFICKSIYSIFIKSGRIEFDRIKNILLFLGFIIGSVVSSAVTIRVEMRWLYAPFLFLLLLVSYVYGADKKITVKKFKNKKIDTSLSRIFHVSLVSATLVMLWGFCMLIGDMYYRGYYDKIYLFEGQNRANSLANETYYKYGRDLSNKRIYIIKNDFKLSDFDALEFFRVYDANIREDIVTFIDNYRDIGTVNEDMIVLSEDKENNEYVNVTDFLKNIKVENIYGHYTDGWTDEEAKFNVMSGEHGKIRFEIMYPGELTGSESILIDANGEKETLDLVSNITYYEIDTTPNTVVPINMKSNFYVPDAKEQRGDKKLSFILNIKIE